MPQSTVTYIDDVPLYDIKYKTEPKKRKFKKKGKTKGKLRGGGILKVKGLKIKFTDVTGKVATDKHNLAIVQTEKLMKSYKEISKNIIEYDHGINSVIRRTLQTARSKASYRPEYRNVTISYLGFVRKATISRSLSTKKGLLEEIRYTVKDARANARRPNTTRKTHPVFGEWFTTGGVRDMPGFFSRASIGLKMKRVEAIKKPTTDAKYVGVELEFFSPLGRTDIKKEIAEHSLEYVCQVVGDGSLHDTGGSRCPECSSCGECEVDGDCCTHCSSCDEGQYKNTDRLRGNEMRILDTEDNIEETVKKVTAAIVGFGGEVNEQCGLHVHLDVRNREPEKAYTALANAQKALFKTVPQSRRDNEYCVITRSSRLSNVGSGRYYAVNHESITQHGSIEVRLHGGTLDSEKINNWISLLKIIIDTPTEARARDKWPDTVSDLAIEYNIPESLTNYYLQRELEFAA